jgi:hypothetical protein
MLESRCWMAAGVLVSERAVTSRQDHIFIDLKATAVEELLNHSEPALIAHSVNIDSHLSLVS